jgi:hypothetical protein
MRRLQTASLLVFGVLCLGTAVEAQVITASFEGIELERWLDVDKKDCPVTIHRVRISTEQAGLRSRSADVALNRNYLQPIAVQIEFTNDSARKYKSYITVRMLDENGEAIDGFGDEEGLDANRARGLVTRSFGASRYGLKRVDRVELEIKLNP